MTRDLVCLTIGVVLFALAEYLDSRYRTAWSECEALLGRVM